MVTLGAIVDLVCLAIVAYFVFLVPTDLEGFESNTGILIAITSITGILWRFVGKKRGKSVGVGASMTLQQAAA